MFIQWINSLEFMKEAQPGSNVFLRWLDTIQEHFTRVKYIDPKVLHTKNRKDIDLKIQFLRDVLEKKFQEKKHCITNLILILKKVFLEILITLLLNLLKIITVLKKMVFLHLLLQEDLIRI